MRAAGDAVPGSPGAMPPGAWAADEDARRRGRVEMSKLGRPGGLDGWTTDLAQHEAVRELILEVLGAVRHPVLLKDLVAEAQGRLGDDPRFPGGRLRNDTIYMKVDLEARGALLRLPQRVELATRPSG